MATGLLASACGGTEPTPEAGSPSPTTGSTTTTAPSTTVAPPSSATPGSDAPPTTAAPGGEACVDPVAAMASWPLRRRLASLVVVGVDPAGTGDATAAVEDHHVGGVFVGGNDTALLTSGALQSLRAGSPTGLMVSVDEEGGRVQRIEGLDGDVPSARDMAASMSTDQVRALARRRARVMADTGVTVDLAPVVDVSDQPDGTVIGDRSWSDDPAQVVAYAGSYAAGLLDEGITPVLKHFPGHGEASGDSHDGAVTAPDLESLRARDLVPYQELLPILGGRTAVMLGHLDVPGLTEDGVPTSLSPATVRLLRDDYGFDGVIMTDDLAAMGAITARLGVVDAAIAALAAGVDVVLLADADLAGLLDRMEQAVGEGDLDEAAIDASMVRTLALKGIDPCTVVL